VSATLALVRRDDFTADVEVLNLLAFAAGWDLLDDGWQQAIAAPDDPSVTEALSLAARGTSHDDLAANVQALDLKLKQMGWFNNPIERYSVWLRAKLNSETNTRQALLLSGKRSPAPLWKGALALAAADGKYYLQPYAVALERAPYWEATTAVSYAPSSSISTVGGTLDYTTYGGSPGAVAGDVPARLARVLFNGLSGGASSPLSKFWLGFRTDRFGSRANFTPCWSLYLGSGSYDADTSDTVDATAKAGHRVVTTFSAVKTLLTRVKVTTTQASAHPSDQRGNYLVLLRAKLSASGQVNVRLRSGITSSAALAALARVPVASTSWNLYELGTVGLPSPGRATNGADPLALFCLGIDAEQVSGSPSLHMDSLILIPAGEGWLSVDLQTPSVGVLYGGGSGSDPQPIQVQDRPDGTHDATWVSGGLSQVVAVPRITDGLPVGAGILVLAGQAYAASTLADVVGVELDVYPRYVTLRGAS